MTELSYTHIDSPVGSLLVAGDGDALHYLSFPNSPNAVKPRSDWHQTDAPFLEVRRQINAYFNGDLQQFDRCCHVTSYFNECRGFGEFKRLLQRCSKRQTLPFDDIGFLTRCGGGLGRRSNFEWRNRLTRTAVNFQVTGSPASLFLVFEKVSDCSLRDC